MRLTLCLAALAILPAQAEAASKSTNANREVRYGRAPDWVNAPPASVPERQSPGGAVDIAYNDIQVRIESDDVVTHQTYRMSILRPEALQLGSLNLLWDPSTTGMTVNRLLVHREGTTIDVLKDHKFSVFQREGRLEQAMLDGLLTANLQIPGLRVGDEIEFASTMVQRGGTFGNQAFGMLMLENALPPGTFRMHLGWVPGREPRWQASSDIGDKIAKDASGMTLLLRDPPTFTGPAGAPARYAVGRRIEYSAFSDWQHVSREIDRLFRKAAVIPNKSSLRTQIDRIAAEHSDPLGRAQAALALAQDSVRYVYTGMNGGNLTPASIEETWERRFGDCKGKTALLLGILSALGIEAQAMMVQSGGGDGLDRWLPSPAAFDHVVVTTTIDGKRYWLDGTRQGEHRMLTDADVGYRWGLPVSTSGEALLGFPYQPPRYPSELTYIDVDSTKGIKGKVRMKVTQVLRGDQALLLNQAFTAQPRETSLTLFRQGQEKGGITPEDVDWRYDEKLGTLTTMVVGEADFDWETEDAGDKITHAYAYLPGGGFYTPAKLERPAAQDQQAPYANTPGRFICSVTRVRLPALPDTHWILTSRSMNRTIGGVEFYRTANLDHSVVNLIRSTRHAKDEITAIEAKAANEEIGNFDNNKAMIQTAYGPGDSTEIVDHSLPDFDKVDWTADPAPCRAPIMG